MKKLLPILLVALFASCSPSRMITPCPKYVGVVFSADSLPPCQHKLANCKCLRVVADKHDTTSEWMHISMRDVGFVINRKALAVRSNGYCISHLDCDKKPFPVHYHVGWCEGKELLFNRLVSQLK